MPDQKDNPDKPLLDIDKNIELKQPGADDPISLLKLMQDMQTNMYQ